MPHVLGIGGLALLTVGLILTVTLWTSKATFNLSQPVGEDARATATRKGHIAMVICIVLFVAIGLGVGLFGFKGEYKVPWFMAFLCIGLLFAAFIPQLITNYYMRSMATNNIMAIWLLLVNTGMILKLTTYRPMYEKLLRDIHGGGQGEGFWKKLSDSNEKIKHTFFMELLIISSTCMPLVMQNIWQWQCLMYNSDESTQQRDLNRYMAPICSFAIIFMCIHAFLPESLSTFKIHWKKHLRLHHRDPPAAAAR